MRFFVCIYICLLGAAASAEGRNQLPVVEVLIPSIVNQPMSFAFLRARQVAAEIFSTIDVAVEWRAARSPNSGCSAEPARRVILVAFSENTPAEFHAAALAISRPYATSGACITVFLDRLKPMVALNPRATESLLGYLLAHEMGHVLQGIARHSETGVLKKEWSLTEVAGMRKPDLRFTSYDRELILDGMRDSRRPAPADDAEVE